MDHPVTYILLLPLIGAFINAVAGWKMPRRAVETIACASVGGSFIAACMALAGMDGAASVTLYDWLSFGGFSAPAGFYLDALSVTMAVMVSGVSFIIHLYSVGYMREDKGYARYFMLLNLFVFSMLNLVLASNLTLLFVGWEGVGFCSYALIGFWYTVPGYATAGRKAFIVTRIGDVAFGVAIIWLFYLAGTTDIPAINALASSRIPAATATFIGLLLLSGAAGKSAQLPLTVWLPDAMAGPTPVSALIHAATMVTAGVYLLMRLFPVVSLSATALSVIAVVGCVTSFYAATAALAQHDLKKVLAYSTISQIGYMFMGVGAGAVSSSLFHLFVHAFFKALLFMGAGCIIQALDEEHDIHKMGGLMIRMPLVFLCFLSGALALAAAPGTAGFFSKDEILTATLSNGSALYVVLWAMGELTAFITALYIFRVVFLVFRDEPKASPKRLPRIMVYSLVPLAMLALVGGLINAPANWGGTERLSAYLEWGGVAPALKFSRQWLVQGVSASVSVCGIAMAYYMYVYNPAWRKKAAARLSGIAGFLSAAWYLDALYNKVVVGTYVMVSGFLWKKVDGLVIDRSLDGTAAGIAGAGTGLRSAVTGRASTYIMSVIIGAAAMLAYFAWS